VAADLQARGVLALLGKEMLAALAQTATQITVAAEAAVETRLAQMLPHP
jgi:hypothetical protein